jgi:DNA-binding MarR family transcriptional regulator
MDEPLVRLLKTEEAQSIPCRRVKMSVARREQSSRGSLSPNEYQILAEFRYQLAGFLRRRKDAARGEGIQPQQYELLLAVTGLPSHKEPTIKELALQLCLEHHTVVELADRLQRKGLLARGTSTEDKRAVLLRVTPAGQRVLSRIVRFSFAQLRAEAPDLIRSLRRILKKQTAS